LPLQLLVGFCLFGAIPLGTLKAIIRFPHQQTPGEFERSLAARLGALFKARGLLQPYGNLLDQ
jgi:hypothetical protein